jgi:hypothetical protein
MNQFFVHAAPEEPQPTASARKKPGKSSAFALHAVSRYADSPIMTQTV